MAVTAQHRLQTRFRDLTTNTAAKALAAVWLFLSGFLFHDGYTAVLVNNVICGGMALPLSLGALARARVSWLTAAIGVWVMISPLVLGFSANEGATWSNVLIGAVITLLALRDATAGTPR